MNLYDANTHEMIGLPAMLMDFRGEEEWYVLDVSHPSGGGSSGKVRAAKTPLDTGSRNFYPGVFGCYIADAPREVVS